MTVTFDCKFSENRKFPSKVNDAAQNSPKQKRQATALKAVFKSQYNTNLVAVSGFDSSVRSLLIKFDQR